MKALFGLLIGLGFCLFSAVLQVAARSPQDPPPAQNPSAAQGAGASQAPGRGGERRPGVAGKLTAAHGDSIEVTRPDGTVVTVKISGNTQFRKEREAAKLSDFKVGDNVFVRGEENADHTWNAEMIGERPAGGFGNGPGGQRIGPGGGAGGARPAGVLGQDYVFGEVKSVDAPKLTILRPDNVSQTVELNEDTSLRKGREAITMADIQPGDHVMVRGGMANNVFQPKSLMVFGPEQWKRMQEMGMTGGAPPANPPPNNPQKDNSQQQRPPEPPH
jgi:hypothetical protein